MTDTTAAAPIAIRRIKPSSMAPLSRRVVAAVSATFAAVGQAFAMAYAAPYRPRPPAVVEIDLQGRDPNW